MVFLTTMLTTADVNVHALIAKYGIDIQIVSFYVSTATFCLLHCDEWDRVVALPRHKFVTGATLLQLAYCQQIKVKDITVDSINSLLLTFVHVCHST